MAEVDLQNKIHIAPELWTEIEEEAQVVVHCRMESTAYADAARIWPTTYIIDNATGRQYQLKHVIGITMYPNWTYIEEGSTLDFILFFGGLPKSCTSFDLKEIIPQPGGFECRRIPRNKTDVYYINFQ